MDDHMTTTDPKPAVSIRLEPRDHERLERYAQARGLSLAAALRALALERLAELEAA